jgi:hypothetical protein
MMVAVFLAMFAALLFSWVGWHGLSLLGAAVCFTLAVWLFLFEIYSNEYGFRMPWIDTRLDLTNPVQRYEA